MTDEEREGEIGPNQNRQHRDRTDEIDVEANRHADAPAAIGPERPANDADSESETYRERTEQKRHADRLRHESPIFDQWADIDVHDRSLPARSRLAPPRQAARMDCLPWSS